MNCNEGHVRIYGDVIRSNSLDFFKVEWSNLLCETNMTEIKGAIYTLLLQLLRELSSFVNYPLNTFLPDIKPLQTHCH